jgi:prephenate dehydrogenase
VVADHERLIHIARKCFKLSIRAHDKLKFVEHLGLSFPFSPAAGFAINAIGPIGHIGPIRLTTDYTHCSETLKIMMRDKVAIIGANGEFGHFLQHDILSGLGVSILEPIERDTSRESRGVILEKSRHVVIATPLAGYAEVACDLIYHLRHCDHRTTLWLIPSVQAGVWRAVSATLEIVGNPHISAVFVHPMYGPNGFRETEPEARTFQNVLTATFEGREHPLMDEVSSIAELFRIKFNIVTTTAFNPDEHDRVTAYSQGLSYCVGRLIFEHPELESIVREQLPDLHHSFRANHDLILDFLRINPYMPQVIAAFADSWRHTRQTDYTDVVSAFADADASLNRGAESPISTKWYEKLRAASKTEGQ